MPIAATRSAHQKKAERIDVRLPSDAKDVIKRAAEIKGMSASDFAVSAAYDAAQATILGQRLMKLDREQSMRLAESLMNPPEPNEALKSLVGSRYPSI